MKTTPQDFDPLVSAVDARKEMGNPSPVTFWRWERDGILPPARRINGRKFWRRSEIEKVKAGEAA